MAGNSAWSRGLLSGGAGSVNFFQAFNAADLNSLPNLSSVLSSVAVFDNTVALDQFMDISFVGAIAAASTIATGAGLAFFLATIQGNGSTIYDGRMTAGTQYANTTYSPLMNSLGGFPISPGTSITNISGSVLNITIPPRKLALVVQNQSGFAFAGAGACSCWVSTYCQNTNA
jgi:hypothetical protein